MRNRGSVLKQLRPVAVELAIVLAAFVVAVNIGPYGTFAELGFGERVQYWGFMIIVNWLQLRLLQAALAAFFGWERFWIITLGACFLASVPATFEVLWLEARFRPQNMDEIGFLSLYPQVLLLASAVMVPVSYMFLGRRQSEASGEEPPASGHALLPGEAFLRRIPAALGRELHAIQAEDHYLRVYTAAGSDLILHRFSDALGELEGVGGLQVHRSWWVARNGVADVVRRERKLFIVLKDGTEAPVSRTYAPAVREAGWVA